MPRSITGWTSRRSGRQSRADQPRVQPEVGRERRLGLQPDQVLDGLHHLRGPARPGGGQRAAGEQ
jgi:hypothetical protein